MELEVGLATFLEAQAAVTAIVGAGDAARIYPNELPQRPTYPAIVYERISGPRVHNLAGPVGHAMPRVRVNVYAETYLAAKGLATAVRQTVDGYRGLMGSVLVKSARIESDYDFYESEVKVHRVALDFVIGHAEAP